MNRIILSYLFSFLFFNGTTMAATLTSTIDDQQDVEVTVYNSNLGLVKDTRRIQLPKGEGEIRFMDVASSIQPYTVHIQSMDQPGSLNVLEQDYEYDLMDSSKLLDKYVGHDIKIMTVSQDNKKDVVDATLLANNNGQIYRINNEIYLGYPGYQVLPEIPDNLIAKPTLTWEYDNEGSSPQTVQVAYLTDNITWQADYIVVVNKDDNEANFDGWVTLDNTSGATYKNAKLKLVAGQVNQVQDEAKKMVAFGGARLAMAAQAPAPQFQEQSFFEYHIYDLQRRTTIKDNQNKQVELLQAEGVGIKKEYLVRGEQNYFYSNLNRGEPMKLPVNVFLKFKNSKANHMGMPLPSGTVRLYKKDAQNSLEFIGEDSIQHTPKDEDVEIKAGEAFDVVAERKQTDFQQENQSFETAWEFSIRNHKDSDIKVGIIEPMYGDWEVLESSVPYKKVDATTLRFDVDVAHDQEVKVTYRIRVRTPR